MALSQLRSDREETAKKLESVLSSTEAQSSLVQNARVAEASYRTLSEKMRRTQLEYQLQRSNASQNAKRARHLTGLIPYTVGKEGLSVVEALSIVDRVVSKIRFVLMERTISSSLRIDLLRLRCDAERVFRFVSSSETSIEMFLKCVTDLIAPFGEAEHVLDSLLTTVLKGSGVSNILRDEVRRLCGTSSSEDTKFSSLAVSKTGANMSRYYADTISLCLVSFEESIRRLNTEASMASKSLLDVSVEDVDDDDDEVERTNTTMMCAAAVCEYVKESKTIDRVSKIRRVVSRLARAVYDQQSEEGTENGLKKVFDLAMRIFHLGETACKEMEDWSRVLSRIKSESDPLLLSLSNLFS